MSVSFWKSNKNDALLVLTRQLVRRTRYDSQNQLRQAQH